MANAYGQLFMPLLVWTVVLALVFVMLVANNRKSGLWFIVKTGRRFATSVSLLWSIHLGIFWYLVRCIIQLQSTSLHLSRAEEVQLWQAVTVACSEMGLLSTLLLIWLSTLLLVAFIRFEVSGKT